MTAIPPATSLQHTRGFRRGHKGLELEAVPRPTTPLQFREAIRALLKEAEIPGAELARRMGVSQSVVGRWTQSKPMAPTHKNVSKIIDAFKDSPRLYALAKATLSDPSAMVSLTSRDAREGYTVKNREAEIVAKALDAALDSYAPEDAHGRFALVSRVMEALRHERPSRAGRG